MIDSLGYTYVILISDKRGVMEGLLALLDILKSYVIEAYDVLLSICLSIPIHLCGTFVSYTGNTPSRE